MQMSQIYFGVAKMLTNFKGTLKIHAAFYLYDKKIGKQKDIMYKYLRSDKLNEMTVWEKELMYITKKMEMIEFSK